MSNGRYIRAIGDEVAREQGLEPEESGISGEPERAEIALDLWDEAADPSPRPSAWRAIMGILAIAAVVAWTGFFVWIQRPAMLAGAQPDQWIGWIAQWATLVLVIAVGWMIAMRNSTREASRFGEAGRALAREAAALETRLVTVNRELSLAREFLAAQSRELEYVGRSAVERISEHADKLQALVIDNGAQVDAIAGVSQTALANMESLRDNLPVIANSARDVTNQIGGAGRTAQTQVSELVAGFERLNEFGQASDRQVASLRQRIDAMLEELAAFVESMDANNASRLQALHDESEALRGAIENRETEGLNAIRERAEALRAEIMAASDARDLEEAATLAAMRGRLASFTREAHEAAATVRTGERTALEAWQGQISALRDRLSEALAEIGTLDEQFLDRARAKLALLTNEAEAVDNRLRERDRAFQERVARRQSDFEASEAAALARLDERAAALDEALGERHRRQIDHATAISERGEMLAAQTAEIESHLVRIVQRSGEAERSLADGAQHFAAAVSTHADQLGDTENALERITDASVRLLELIQAAAAHSREDLPAAIAGFEGKLEATRDNGARIQAALEETRKLSEDVTALLLGVQTRGQAATETLDAFRSGLTDTTREQADALDALRQHIAATGEDNRALAQSIATELAASLARISEEAKERLAALREAQVETLEGLQTAMTSLTAEQEAGAQRAARSVMAAAERLTHSGQAALDDLEGGQGARIDALAARIGEESAAAIDRAIEARTDAAVIRLEEATAKSADTTREVISNLRDQLARVHELTVNLETRAARAREQVEEQVDGDFSRRMALITESLNSHSIDIAKALSTEVTDTAWASYLKGDRGVFTRRAVRLIDGGEARSISALYESDQEFSEHVSRYIHDFEAMLRTMLSTRDGHALGVTLLSSDMGKLYVALAQSIQRLRQ